MSYAPEWIIPGACVALVVMLCAAPIAMIAVGVILFAVLVAVVALAGAILATPYLLFRSVRRRQRSKDEEPTVNSSTGRSSASTDPLVEALETRLHRVDLIGWVRITARAEELALSFEALRLLLALATRDGPSSVSDLARISGLSLQAAYPAARDLRSRGYLREERRRYSLSEDGQELMAVLEAAHREGIEAYIEGLDASERDRLDEALRMTQQAAIT